MMLKFNPQIRETRESHRWVLEIDMEVSRGYVL
jgi:hypothetical protein